MCCMLLFSCPILKFYFYLFVFSVCVCGLQSNTSAGHCPSRCVHSAIIVCTINFVRQENAVIRFIDLTEKGTFWWLASFVNRAMGINIERDFHAGV